MSALGIELEQIRAEIDRLDTRQREIYRASLAAAQADKACADWIAAWLGGPENSALQFPVTLQAITLDDSEAVQHHRADVGAWVAVRPVTGPAKGKTLLGIYIGDVALSHAAHYVPETGVLHIGFDSHNPAIWAPSQRVLIYGCASWWGVLKTPEDLKQITDEDIQSIWYVRAMKELSAPKAEGKP